MSKSGAELTTLCAWNCESNQPKLLFKSRESRQNQVSKSALFDRHTCFDDLRSNASWEAWLENETRELSNSINRKPGLFEIPNTTLIISCLTLIHIPGALEKAEPDPLRVRKRSQHRRSQWIYLNNIQCHLNYDWQPNADDNDYDVIGQDNKRLDAYTLNQRPLGPFSEHDLEKKHDPHTTVAGNIGSRMLALVDRHCAGEDEPHANQVHHWFLDLDIIDHRDGELKAVRRDLIDVLVPKDCPEALDDFEPMTRRIFLV